MAVKIDSVKIQRILDAWSIPGCAIAIVHRQQDGQSWERQLHCIGRKNGNGDAVDEGVSAGSRLVRLN
jgi:hypothetical protein